MYRMALLGLATFAAMGGRPAANNSDLAWLMTLVMACAGVCGLWYSDRKAAGL